MKQFSIIFLFALFIASNNQSIAQTKSAAKKATAKPTSASGALTNANVIALFKAGLQNQVILSAINSSACKFDTSVNAILGLKSQGVPDEIVSAMVNKTNGTPVVATSVRQENETASSGQLSKLDPGIYYGGQSSADYLQLEASVFSQSKVGSGILSGLTYGIAKTKAKAILSGSNSNTEIKAVQPVFYFIFPKGNSGGLGNEANQSLWYSNATSPNEFILIKFKSINTSRQKGREVVTGSFGTYSGFSGGIADENKVNFRYSKVSPGIYKVYFETPVAAGEYAFIFAGQSTSAVGGSPSQKAFDFSIVTP